MNEAVFPPRAGLKSGNHERPTMPEQPADNILALLREIRAEQEALLQRLTTLAVGQASFNAEISRLNSEMGRLVYAVSLSYGRP